jgi:hypothetical protein
MPEEIEQTKIHCSGSCLLPEVEKVGMKSQAKTVPAHQSSELYCKYDQCHPIRSQWGIVEAEMSTKFRHGERSIPGSRPSTIRLTGMPCPKEEMEETTAHHEEGNSSSHRT